MNIYVYDLVEALTLDEVRALARRILLVAAVGTDSETLYQDPDRVVVYATAQRLGVPPTYLLEGDLGKLAIARALVGDPKRTL